MIMNREDTLFGDDWPYTKAKSSLLRSAAVVMREQGPRAATLKNIAGKTGVTEPAIFRHFDGVDGLFESLFAVAELYYGLFASCLEKAGGSGLDRLEAAFSGIADALHDDADFAYVIAYPNPVFRQYDKLKDKVGVIEAALRSAVGARIEEAKAAGQLAPAAATEAVTEAILGAFGRVLAAWADDVKAVDPREAMPRILGGTCAFARKSGLKPKPAAKPELRLAAERAASAAPESPAPKKPSAKKPATDKAPKAGKKAPVAAAKPAAKAKATAQADKPEAKAPKVEAKAPKAAPKAAAKASAKAPKAPAAKKEAAKPVAEPKKTKKK